MPHESIAFAAGHCVHYGEEFDPGNTGPGAYICHLTITAPVFELLAGGPSARAATAVAAVSQVVKAPAAPALSLASAPAMPTVAGWLVELETVLGPAAGVRSLVASWVAGGLDEAKLGAFMHGAPNKQEVFERLLKASDPQQKGRGIYHQRVVIDDYASIPGVENKPYVKNGLPKAAIPAINFGVSDPSLDLPAGNAPTFAGSATLVEIKPGEKLYRVTNDPASEPFARTGGYWTRTPPADLAGVVGGTAVMPEWNNFQRVYEFTAPPYADPVNKEPKFYAWEGPTAAQPVSGDYVEKMDNGYCLPGGDSQIFVPNKHSRDAKFGDTIQDITSAHKSW